MKDHVIKEVNRIFNCDVSDSRRKKNNVNGRVAFSYYMRLKSKLKLKEIGQFFNKDTGAVFRNTKIHHNFFRYDFEYRQMYLELERINPMNICNQSVFMLRVYKRGLI